jgi:hypothetical protein
MMDTILTPDERQRISLYFGDLRIRYALGVLLVGVLLAEFALGKVLLLVGILWLAGALALGRRRPSDQEVDTLFSRDLKALVDEAVRRLPQEQGRRAPPLALYEPAELRRGPKARGHRSPVHRVVVLLPMEEQLAIYSCQHDFLTGQNSQVSIEEHHYRDVVTVRLEQDVEAAGAQRPNQVFSLELTNGRRLNLPVSAVWQEESGDGKGPQPTGLERTVQAIRALMRDKR